MWRFIRLLLAAGANPNARTLNDAWTPFHVAANGGGDGHVEAIRLLLTAGADPYARTLNGGWTPLHIAANGGGDGHVEIIRLLLEYYGLDSFELFSRCISGLGNASGMTRF